MSIVDYSWLQSGQGHMEKATSRSQIYTVILRIHFNNYLLKSAILPHEEHHLYVLLIFKLKYYVAFFLEAPFIAVFRVITAISLTQCYILILLTPKSIFSSFSPYFYFSWFLYHLLWPFHPYPWFITLHLLVRSFSEFWLSFLVAY